MPKPIVALVGRPNVGKSTLFNRLAGERLAVVDDTPGTTRDRLLAEAEWNGVVFHIVDTGGIEPEAAKAARLAGLGRAGEGRAGAPVVAGSAPFVAQMRAQAELAIREADAVLFLTDVITGATAADHEVATLLRRQGGVGTKPVLLVVNKVDNLAREAEVAEFYELGLGDPWPISALHGLGVADVLDALLAALPRAGQAEPDDESPKIAIVGRPNVGKSSLLNRLLGEDRAIVSPIPGTTRDAIDTTLIYDGTPITLIDTAGIRRRGKIDPGVERYSVLRALRAIERADVALLLIDAVEGVEAQDAHIAGMVIDQLKSVVVLINKWDAVPKETGTLEAYGRQVRQTLQFLDFVPLLFISAKTGQRVDRVLPTALEVQAARQLRVPTAELNRLVREATLQHAPPSRSGRRLKFLYASQVRTDPPTFLFHVNDPTLVHFTYERYLENQLRERYGFPGTPLRLSFRERGD